MKLIKKYFPYFMIVIALANLFFVVVDNQFIEKILLVLVSIIVLWRSVLQIRKPLVEHS